MTESRTCSSGETETVQKPVSSSRTYYVAQQPAQEFSLRKFAAKLVVVGYDVSRVAGAVLFTPARRVVSATRLLRGALMNQLARCRHASRWVVLPPSDIGMQLHAIQIQVCANVASEVLLVRDPRRLAG